VGGFRSLHSFIRDPMFMTNDEVDNTLKDCVSLKPTELIISDLKWKYLVRAVLRAKNVMIIGPSGCAKTMAARCVAQAFAEEKEETMTEDQLTLLKSSPNIKIEKVESMILSK
jgi:ABC-type transporter Mla maintaining outer membrane lipid asymmetry ATPase subunit MlaF